MTTSPADTSHFAPGGDDERGSSGGTMRTLRGRVLSPPAGDSDVILVGSIERAAETFLVPSGQWQTGATLPAQNALCLIVVDDKGDAWVPCWVGMTASLTSLAARVADLESKVST